MSNDSGPVGLARRWHALSDHAADGTPFGAGLCNCLKQAERIETLMAQERTRIATAIRYRRDEVYDDALGETAGSAYEDAARVVLGQA